MPVLDTKRLIQTVRNVKPANDTIPACRDVGFNHRWKSGIIVTPDNTTFVRMSEVGLEYFGDQIRFFSVAIHSETINVPSSPSCQISESSSTWLSGIQHSLSPKSHRMALSVSFLMMQPSSTLFLK